MLLNYDFKFTYQDIDTERHHDDRNQKIRDRQRHYKIVRDSMKSSLANHRQDDQHVSEECEEGEQDQQQGPVVVLNCRRETVRKIEAINAESRNQNILKRPFRPQLTLSYSATGGIRIRQGAV